MSGMPATTSTLSLASKRELLADALRKKARSQTTVAPLSYGQKALWFLYCSAPQSAAYHVSFSARIHSVLDVDVLRSAFQSLIDRHSALRAVFRLRGGVPVQEIAGHRDVSFEIADTTNCSDEALHCKVADAYRRPFNLEEGPAFRVNLFRCAADDHVLLVTVHHIVYDAWSLWVNLDEIGQLYAAGVAGRAAGLPPLANSYRDYVRLQQDMLAGPEGERLWQFWKRELAGDLPTIDLPIDRPRPPVQTYEGTSFQFALDTNLSQRLRELARTEGVTPFMLLLAAFHVLLHRYSGQEDILVGSPTTGRGDPRFAGVAGYFVNPVVMRANLAGNPRFSALLRQVANTAAHALQYQDFPFPLLVERLQPRRDPSLAPLFQVLFVYQKPQRSGSTLDWLSWSGTDGLRIDWGGLEIEYFDQPQQEGQFDLELEVLDAYDTLRGSFKYNTGLFLPATIEQLSQCFSVLLQSIARDPHQPVRNLALLEAEEAQRLRFMMPERPSDPARAQCLHHTFEGCALARPHAIAVSCGDLQLTYGDLNEAANCVAHHLISLGVCREARVGICLERSWRMVVAMLAVVKAGGAYVPIAPEAPPERNAFILQDSDIAVLLTEQPLAGGLAEAPRHVVCLDTEWSSIQSLPRSNPQTDVTVDNLLYVIYTSGSTGKPKGALVTHFNVARLFTSTAEWFEFGARDVWSVFHSFAFDFSVWEMWGALLYGGRLVVVPYLVSRSPADFLELLNREGVTVLNQTPSAFRQLLEAEQARPLPVGSSLRYVIFGGEALDLKMLARWYERHDERHPCLVNMYGITETTVHVTYRPLSTHDLVHGRSVIGRPLPDLQIHLLDESLEPVPPGVRGEIYVAGAGLCRGYLQREQLTRERFVERAHGRSGTLRLYRTGDLARRLKDGDIEYLGRADDQVKIRGFRIELGEIEAVIAQCPHVKENVVLVREDQGDKRLVAYVAGHENAVLTGSSLREYLMTRLPDYMIPAACVVLDQLPLNSNGKIDRRALPAPALVRHEAGRSLLPPRDAVEQAMLREWEAVLGINPIGVRDDFFALGGHSLLAVNLIARIEKEFGQRLPMATLFRRPTVESLAEVLRGQVPAPPSSSLVPVQPHGSLPAFFCVAGGGGSALYYYPLARHLGADQPFFGLQAIGLDGECEPLSRVEELAAAYVDEIRTVQPDGPYLLGGHCFGGLVAFEMSQQLRRQGEEVALVLLMDVPARYPDTGGEPMKVDDTTWLIRLAGVMKESSGFDLGMTEAALRQETCAAQLQYFNERMQAAGYLPPGADVSKVRGLLRVFATNSAARYEPQNCEPVPIALLRAGEFHPDYDFSAADDPGRSIEESSLGWSAYALGDVAVQVVPGNHITMMSEPHVAQLAECVANNLRAAGAAYTANKQDLTQSIANERRD